MRTEEINALIQERAALPTPDSAYRAAGAVLTELGRREIGGEGLDVAAQLPEEYKNALSGPGGELETFTEEEFLHRVGSALELNTEEARRVAHAVVSSVTDAVSSGERASFAKALPREFSAYARWN